MLCVLGIHPAFVCNAFEKVGVNKKGVNQKRYSHQKWEGWRNWTQWAKER